LIWRDVFADAPKTFAEARTSEDRNFGVMVIQSENYIFLGAMIYQQ
jgi:hypothetical protein